MRRGGALEDVARQMQCTLDYCRLALEFSGASDLIKLRALVEDWSPAMIAAELSVRDSVRRRIRCEREKRVPHRAKLATC